MCLCYRNDAMEDRYSVLIRLGNQLDADAFYCSFNGKKFRPSEVIYPLQMDGCVLPILIEISGCLNFLYS